MRKASLLLLMLSIIVSVFVVSASAEQTNMEVIVPRFTDQPVFDGNVTTEEWGEATVRVVTEGAATTDDDEVSNNKTLGLKNTFYYYETEGICDTLAYDLWFRWDDDYLYVAAMVDDPDPFSLPEGNEQIWNGDCIQICVDDNGPNAIMSANKPGYNFRTDAFDGNTYVEPWIDSYKIFNGAMGLAKGTDLTFWRFSTYVGESIDLMEKGTLLNISVDEHADDTCTITYEGAIPWSLINTGSVPKSGNIYGVSVAVACSDSDSINACLQWGTGVMYVRQQPEGTRGGSQAMILGSDEVTPYAKPETETTATETEPETEPPEIVSEEVPESFDGGEIYGDYVFSVNGDEATLTEVKNTVKGNITVPADYNGYKVTAVGEKAFCYCDELTGVMIPYGVTSIGDWAFYGCSALEEVEIPSGVEEIGDEAFYGCKNLARITIPDGVKSIGNWAFFMCDELENIGIPDSVNEIGEDAFKGCKNLTIQCSDDSFAEEYAEANEISYNFGDDAKTVEEEGKISTSRGSSDSTAIIIIAAVSAIAVVTVVLCVVIVKTKTNE